MLLPLLSLLFTMSLWAFGVSKCICSSSVNVEYDSPVGITPFVADDASEDDDIAHNKREYTLVCGRGVVVVQQPTPIGYVSTSIWQVGCFEIEIENASIEEVKYKINNDALINTDNPIFPASSSLYSSLQLVLDNSHTVTTNNKQSTLHIHQPFEMPTRGIIAHYLGIVCLESISTKKYTHTLQDDYELWTLN